MAVNGMTTMMKAMGLDPDELKATVEQFMGGMKDQAAKINANQGRLETKLDVILMKLAELSPIVATRQILENGEATGVLITNERFPQEMIDDVNGGPRDGGGIGNSSH